MKGLSESFPLYKDFNPEVETRCVTPGKGAVFHRFFDTPPFSPSGRYLCAFRMPYEDKLAQPGDAGEVVVVDLLEGTERVVATTRGWETQMGSNLQWGKDDDTLIFNDVDAKDWSEFGVRLNWRTGERQRLEGSVYRVSPDGKKALSGKLSAMRRTQSGYGVVVPDSKVPRHRGLKDDEGLWLTDLETGKRKLLISIKEAVERTVPKTELDSYAKREVYVFHSKWNAQGSRIMFTLRHFPGDIGI